MSNAIVLVLNCGSSSVKGAVVDSQTGEVLFSCLGEKLNLPDAFITFKYQGEKEVEDLSAHPHHTGAIEAMLHALERHGLDKKIGAVGHRIVHGGEHFKESTIVDEAVIDNIQKCITLAPLHNPAHLLGIAAAQNVFHHIPHIVVFDTAFHQTMPDYAYTYAVPYELYKETGLRRYGAHGTSVRYVSGEAARMLNRPIDKLALVVAHLGNGSSITAVKNGKVQDTSMGLTPLEGLVMGTRCGDIDASVFSFLHEQKGYDIAEITNILNKKSGLLGISGVSNDYRVVEESAITGNSRALLALEVFSYRLAKYIAAMTVATGHLDALVFTGGIGENSKTMRAKVLEKLGFLGLVIDDKLNAEMRFGKAGIITVTQNPLAMVIPTNEELMIAQDAAKLAGLV